MLASVDADRLVALASEHRLVIALVPMVGDFIPGGGPVLQIWGAVDRGCEHALTGCLHLAAERTLEEDVGFGIRQLVDVAERALSPGTNDPSTAIQALDQLHDLLRRLCVRRFPSPQRAGRDGVTRLIVPRPDFEDYLGLALNEIRRAGATSLQVARRLRVLLDDLEAVAPPARRRAIARQLSLLDDSVRAHFPDKRDAELALQSEAQRQHLLDS